MVRIGNSFFYLFNIITILKEAEKPVVKCPYCGYEDEHILLKTWKYKWWNVYYYQCPTCNGKFRYQVDPEGKRKSYVIRVGVGKRARGS